MSGLHSRGPAGAAPGHGSGTPWGCSGCWGTLPWPPAPAAFPVGSSAQSEEAKPSPRRQRSRAPALSPAAVLPVPSGRCPLCPARARWQLSPSVATEPQRGLSSAYTALAPSKVSQHSCFSLTQARSCVPCPLRHNVPAWRLRGSSQHSAVVEAERGPCARHFARPRVQMVWG